MKRNILFIFLIVFFCSLGVMAQTEKWYLPWENRVSKLIETDNEEEIPVLYNRKNYRILKISDNENVLINDVKASISKNKVNVYSLPLMKNYNSHDILDVVLPLSNNIKTTEHYLLVEFIGKMPGAEKVTIEYTVKNKRKKVEKNIFVSNDFAYEKLNSNVWAYFDHDVLTKDLKSEVIDDLIDKDVNMLVIKPKVLPSIQPTITTQSFHQLENYLEGTIDKFEYYVLFLSYRFEKRKSLTFEWQQSYIKWIKEINRVFRKHNISEDRVLIYPVDEPKVADIAFLKEIVRISRLNNITNPYYITLGGSDRHNVLELVKDFDFVQVALSSVANVLKVKNRNTKILNYSAIGRSRNISPKNYINYSIQAYKHNIDGIGFWHYSNISNALSATQKKDFLQKKSWDIKPSNSERDYSVIYRYSDNIYPSLRWLAFSYGQDEYIYLKHHESLYGKKQTMGVLDKHLNRNSKLNNWEAIKLDLIK